MIKGKTMRWVEQVIDQFKSDELLMQEEMALFAQVMKNDEQERAGQDPPPLDPSIYTRHIEKMRLLIDRGHRTDNQGGWLY